MRLFGDILPFVGFRTVDTEQLFCRGMLDALSPSPVGKWELLEVEWLGHGFTIAGRPVTERTSSP